MSPLTKTGKKIKSNMEKEYGDKKGLEVFYATMNKKKMRKKWEDRTKRINKQ